MDNVEWVHFELTTEDETLIWASTPDFKAKAVVD